MGWTRRRAVKVSCGSETIIPMSRALLEKHGSVHRNKGLKEIFLVFFSPRVGSYSVYVLFFPHVPITSTWERKETRLNDALHYALNSFTNPFLSSSLAKNLLFATTSRGWLKFRDGISYIPLNMKSVILLRKRNTNLDYVKPVFMNLHCGLSCFSYFLL